MRLLDQSSVQADEIDTLGHMNVRFYLLRVLRSHEALMESFGLGREVRKARGVLLSRVDSYCRYHREQFPGATLEVRGAVLDADDQGLRLFYEVTNSAKGEIAATFIMEFALLERATRARIELPAEILARTEAALAPLPDYGAPRSVRLGTPNLAVSLAALEARLTDDEGQWMHGRMERIVEAAECDEHGFLRDGEDLMFGARRRAAIKPGQTFGPPTFVSDEGHRFGWAWMETRLFQRAFPRVGDVLRSIGADIGIERKTRHSRRWIFNVASGDLVAVDDTVGIALDLDARRSIEIPTKVRADLQTRFLPELA